MKKEDKKLVYSGIAAGVFGSLCCVGPVVLVLLGLAGVSTALTIGKYGWIFNIIAVLFLISSIVVYTRRKKCTDLKEIKRLWKPIVLSFILFSVLLIALKYWAAPAIARIAYS